MTFQKALHNLLLLVILNMAGMCSSPPQSVSPQKQTPLPVKKVQEPYLTQQTSPELLKEFNLPEINGLVQAGDPIAITNLQVIKGTGSFRSLLVEMENRSDKPAKLIAYMLAYPPACPEFIKKGALILSYGNSDLVNTQNATLVEQPIYPGHKVTKVFKDDELIASVLNPNTFKKCPPERRKPYLKLRKVLFEDGTLWDPTADLYRQIHSSNNESETKD